MRKNVKFFVNLTMGIEFLKDAYIFADEHVNFVRIRSSHLEAGDYYGILEFLDENLLMHLALGYECIILDASNKDRIPRALRIGVAWIEYVLNRAWFGTIPDKVILPSKGQTRINVVNFFNDLYNNMPHKIKKKIKYYKKFLDPTIVANGKVNLKFWYRKSDLDGKWYKILAVLRRYRNVAEKHWLE